MNNQQTIKTINQVFFDTFAEIGGQTPEYIEAYQEQMWRETVEFALAHLRRTQPRIVALELGAGRGYATTDLYQHLRSGDSLVCNDISAGMLSECRNRLAELGAKRSGDSPRVSFVQGSYDTVKLEERANLVFMNSVAHHMPDLRAFFAHIDSQLAPGGLIVLGREPNHDFWNHWLLFPLNLWTSRAAKVARGVRAMLGKPAAPRHDSEAEAARIAVERLHERGITQVGSVPLTSDNIGSFVDIQAPQGATREEKQKGLSVRHIIDELRPSVYETMQVRTYSHIATIEVNGLVRPLDQLMSRAFPRSGMHMLAVLAKRSERATGAA